MNRISILVLLVFQYCLCIAQNTYIKENTGFSGSSQKFEAPVTINNSYPIIINHSYLGNNNSNDYYNEYYSKGIEYFTNNAYSKAIDYLKWFMRYEEEAPEKVVSDANFYIGLSYQYIQKYDSAIVYFTKSINKDPKCKTCSFSFYQIGNCYANYDNLKYDLDSAIYYYKRALENPSAERYFELIYTQIGKCYFYQGENDATMYDRAIEWYNKAIKQNFRYPDVYNCMGNLYFNKKDYKVAIEYYNKVVELFHWDIQYTHIIHDSATYTYSLTPNYYAIGDAYLYQKEYDRAIEHYNEAAKFRGMSIFYALSMGEVYFDKKEYGESIKCFRAINDTTALDSNSTNMLLFIANAYFDNRIYDKTIYYCEKAIELDSIEIEAYLLIGNAYFWKQNYNKNKPNYNKAIYYYEKAIEISPINIDAHLFIGNVYYQKQNYDKAIYYSEKAIELGNNNTIAYLFTGLSYYNKQNYDKALHYFKEVIKLDSINIDAHLLIGNAYFQKGKKYYNDASVYYQKAIDNFQKNTLLPDAYAKPYWGMGCDYLKKKYRDNAIQCFKIAAKFENQEVQQWFNDNQKWFKDNGYDIKWFIN